MYQMSNRLLHAGLFMHVTALLECLVHPEVFTHVSALYGVSVNYSGNSSCYECIYQSYMERQYTILVIFLVMKAHTYLKHL